MNSKQKLAFIVFLCLIAFLFLIHFGVFDINLPSLSDYKGWLPGLIAFAALLDSVNPCAFSVLFLTIAFLFSLGRSRKSILKAGFVYIFGIFAVYILIGL